jgi:hypothetical protein
MVKNLYDLGPEAPFLPEDGFTFRDLNKNGRLDPYEDSRCPIDVLLANFGASDAAVLDVVFGRFTPSAKLPFEMPSSMEAVRKQKEDVPYDSENPLFAFGHGLTYQNRSLE